MSIFGILSGAIIALSFVYLCLRLKFWRESYWDADDRLSELYNRTIEAERKHAEKESELNYLRQSVVLILNRPVVAVFNDEQYHGIVQTISQMISASSKDPSKLN